jgi:Bifunctional DNA primase/polymerase, N-terminal
MSNANKLLAHAHDYAERFGWAIIPVKGKEPACRWRRYQQVCPTRKQRGGLFSIKAITGLAVIPGEVSGYLRVRDYDDEGAYNRWAEAHNDLSVLLPTVRTRRGYHVYFRADISDGVTKFGDGEMRAGKCIVLLPPSSHTDGGSYEWILEPKGDIPLVSDVTEAGLHGLAPAAPPGFSQVPSEVAEAIAKTLPTGPGQRHDLIFKFARRLKGVSGLDTSDAAMWSYIEEWHRQAQPFINTKDLPTTQVAFFDSWKHATVPLSDEQFWTVVKEGLKEPEPEWFKGWFFPPTGKRLTRVCMALQKHWKEEPFFLSARTAGQSVGIAPKDAHALLKRLITEGFLLPVEKGTYEKRLATTWRYLGPAA